MKRILKGGILLGIFVVILQGCTIQDGEKPVLNSSNTETIEEKDELKDVQRVGEIHYGFVDIPYDWVKFKDVDVSEPIIQYSDLSGRSIITLNAWKKFDDTTAELVATSLWGRMEEQGGVNIEGATVELGDNPAFQVWGAYPNEDKVLVAWVFETDDDYLHYISAEASGEGIVEMVESIEKSFSLEK